MAIEETFRHEFQIRVEEALDAESARFLMAHLPPVPWPDVATKHDLEIGLASVRGEMEIGFASIRGEMHTGSASIRDEMHTESASIREALANQRADLALMISNQTRTMIFALLTAFVAISSLALFR